MTSVDGNIRQDINIPGHASNDSKEHPKCAQSFRPPFCILILVLVWRSYEVQVIVLIRSSTVPEAAQIGA